MLQSEHFAGFMNIYALICLYFEDTVVVRLVLLVLSEILHFDLH